MTTPTAMGNVTIYSKLDELDRVDPFPLEEHDIDINTSKQTRFARIHRHHTHGSRRRPSWLLLAAGFVVTNVVSCLIGAASYRRTLDLDASCAEHKTQYSPVLKNVPIKYDWVHFNGSFLNEDVFRLQAGPEADAAWESVGVDYRAGVIPAEYGPKSGLTDAHVQVSEQYGGGFFVNVEGMHHLHCLNLVRKSLFYNIDYYRSLGKHAFLNDGPILQKHVSHCLDTVRQVLMCNVDTAVLGQVWYDQGEGLGPAAFPDFQTRHMCKNFDDVRQWAEKLQAAPPETLPADFLPRPGAADVLPETP